MMTLIRKLRLSHLFALLIAMLLSSSAWFTFKQTKQVPAVMFTLLSGEKISTRALAGKVYLVHFWATSCAACLKEMPLLTQTYQLFKEQGLELIAVAMRYDVPTYVRNYSQTQQLPFKVALDDGNAAQQFDNVQLTPTTFVIGKNARILKRYIGIPEQEALHALLQTALSTPS
jgi:thiol-disulfide isomerase/thioredoxin